MKWLQTYTGFWRNLRLLHFIYNYINRQKLKRNKDLYKRFGIKKSVYSSISSKDFIGKPNRLPWLDYPVTQEKLMEHPVFMQFDKSIQTALLGWHRNGFLVLPSFYNDNTIDKINQDIELLLETEMLQFNYTKKKVMNAFQYSEIIRQTIQDSRLKSILEFILENPVIPFQTINFIQGSEQAPHSDAIHMSTYPQGNLIAAWIALEDIQLEAGAIEYYLGSHQLPYLTNKDIGAKNNFLFLDANANAKHEIKTAKLIKDNNLKPSILTAKKGDVLIWHSNLIHGGLPIQNPKLTRKSMVTHYFTKDVICYHEISERPALIFYPNAQIF